MTPSLKTPNLIAEKLNLDKRSIKNILANQELVDRVLKEDVIRIQDAATNGLTIYTLWKLVKSGAISSFSNVSHRKGSQTFIFTAELEPYLQTNYTSSAIWHDIQKTVELYLKIAPLSPKERQLVMSIVKQEILPDQSTSYFRAKQKAIIDRVYKATTFSANISLLENRHAYLEASIANLERRRDALKEELKVQEVLDSKNEEALVIPLSLVDLSARARTTLKRFNTLRDVVAWTPEEISKIQCCGAKTLYEIQDVLKSYGLWLGYFSLPKPF